MTKKIFSSLFLFVFVFLLYSCKDDHTQFTMDEDNYEAQKQDVATMEYKSPQKFLTIKKTSKKNILGQTVIKGTVFNTAKVATFKDIDLKLQFYSKTGVLLEEDMETIFEKINAGGSTKFVSKYFSPKGSDSVSVTVIGAKPVK